MKSSLHPLFRPDFLFKDMLLPGDLPEKILIQEPVHSLTAVSDKLPLSLREEENEKYAMTAD